MMAEICILEENMKIFRLGCLDPLELQWGYVSKLIFKTFLVFQKKG